MEKSQMYNNRQKPSFREGVDDIFITYFRSSGIWPACCHLFTYYHTLFITSYGLGLEGEVAFERLKLKFKG